VYLENYTVDFPYTKEALEKVIRKKIRQLGRSEVENPEFLKNANKEDISLLVYGNPLSATTHISLILECKKKKIRYRIIHAESILTAIAETGLQLYKFGKTASMPKWQKSFEPTSFFDIIIQNQNIGAHTLLLTDINLSPKEALGQLQESSKRKNAPLSKVIICSQVGRNTKMFYDTIENLKKKKIPLPFCIIIPSELHFVEEEALNVLKEKN
jgi:diphthine synthase